MYRQMFSLESFEHSWVLLHVNFCFERHRLEVQSVIVVHAFNSKSGEVNIVKLGSHFWNCYHLFNFGLEFGRVRLKSICRVI